MEQIARIAVIIVNWNNWEDTARCITACKGMTGFCGDIYVVDNGSSNDSYLRLQDYLAGRLTVHADSDNPIIRSLIETPASPHDSTQVYLLDSGHNGGFAYGNNVGLEQACKRGGYQYYWLLNSDALPVRDCYQQIVAALQEETTPFVAGTVMMEYWAPDTIQAVGARLNKCIFRVGHRDEGQPRSSLQAMPERIPVDYPIGASLVLNQAYIEQHGLLDDRYFLYFEELDLCARVSPERVFIIRNALVHHKGSASINGEQAKTSAIAEINYIRSRLWYGKKLGRRTYAKALLGTAITLLYRVLKGKFYLLPSTLTGLKQGVLFSSRHDLQAK